MKKIIGMDIYYYNVCKRKLWYFNSRIQMENNSESVRLGRIIDENSYSREDKHININNIINIDFIHNDILCETKKSRKIEEASVMQMKYYLYYLKINGVDGFKGEINYPTLKQKIEVILTDDDISDIEKQCDEIQKIKNLILPPQIVKKSYCKCCAYYDLCYI